MSAMRARMRKELQMLETDPPHGVSAWPVDDRIDRLEAQILGPEDSPYEKGVFHLDIEIPERYPFEPPKVTFKTPIFHPNIDDAGRICLDTLKMQPKGSWLPSVNISTLLTTIRLLMSEPNADDGLMPEVTNLYKHNIELFNRKAAEHTHRHARKSETMRSTLNVVAEPKEQNSAAIDEEMKQLTKPIEGEVEPSQTQHENLGNVEVILSQRRAEPNNSDDDSDDWSDDDDEDELEAPPKRQRR
ncbi:TPA: hypothetical protein N0F65_010736 [Lagenidium giganteum]|uniref:E2 ubiquitin-conjugating enzyme n=1 Tax=Lagenidium giganteum TaxID=4803 RepID=A0AAV2YSK9_9STRA|nr:TPA: hypothetical protein N0F65_010736 [Lagenidium giganteum]